MQERVKKFNAILGRLIKINIYMHKSKTLRIHLIKTVRTPAFIQNIFPGKFI